MFHLVNPVCLRLYGFLIKKQGAMKLRIQAGSLRLRLTQSEVKQFAQTGRVEESVALAPGDAPDAYPHPEAKS